MAIKNVGNLNSSTPMKKAVRYERQTPQYWQLIYSDNQSSFVQVANTTAVNSWDVKINRIEIVAGAFSGTAVITSGKIRVYGKVIKE